MPSFSSDALTEQKTLFYNGLWPLKKLLIAFIVVHSHLLAWVLAEVCNFSPPVLSSFGFTGWLLT